MSPSGRSADESKAPVLSAELRKYMADKGIIPRDGQPALHRGESRGLPDEPPPSRPQPSSRGGRSQPAPARAVATKRSVTAASAAGKTGRLTRPCPTCSGSGREPARATSIRADADLGEVDCRACRGTGRLNGRAAELSELDRYRDEPCEVTDRILELADRNRVPQRVRTARGEVVFPPTELELLELRNFERHRNPDGGWEEQSDRRFVVSLTTSGDFAITERTLNAMESNTEAPYYLPGEEKGPEPVFVTSPDDVYALFDFSAYFSWESGHNSGIEHYFGPGSWFGDRPGGTPSLTREYEKGYGILARLEELLSPAGLERRAREAEKSEVSERNAQAAERERARGEQRSQNRERLRDEAVRAYLWGSVGLFAFYAGALIGPVLSIRTIVRAKRLGVGDVVGPAYVSLGVLTLVLVLVWLGLATHDGSSDLGPLLTLVPVILFSHMVAGLVVGVRRLARGPR